MRSAMNPLDNPSQGDVIKNNLIGGNSGNMIFAYGVMRTLMCEDTQIDTIKFFNNVTDEEIERINSQYDYFVIPLANAFRVSLMDNLQDLTSFISRLKIPCIVIGVGIQAKTNASIYEGFPFDDVAKQFVKEVLNKSEIIGVRGEITAEYMKHLGFLEEKDFTVIGCPSMYIHGDTLPLKTPVELTPKSLVSVNRKINIPRKLHSFITTQSGKFDNCIFVPQGIDDLMMLYGGTPINKRKYPHIHESYPSRICDTLPATNHEIGFTNVPSWIEFLHSRDFTFGTRIHGNIASIISGTPTYIFSPDARVLELAKYHNIQHISAENITSKTDIFKLYEKADFYSVQKSHKQRFNHYIDLFGTKSSTEYLFR